MEGGMTERGTGVSLVVMYEDESLEVRYANGAQLQLSPCGCEFMLVKANDAPSGLPPRRTERVRQRTRFTISTYKEMLMNALTFRNKYASQPYLPEELIPTCHKKPFYSINLDVKWPESSSCGVERGPGDEIIIRSEEGRAALMLSPSGEEFSVEFICNLSQCHTKLHSVKGFSWEPEGSSGGQRHERTSISEPGNDKSKEVHQRDGSRKSDRNISRSCSPHAANASQPKPEAAYQSTTVVQHHSCRTVNPLWSYPLSLARHIWTTGLLQPADGSAEADKGMLQAQREREVPQMTVAEKESCLPKALPLTCQSPHWHRWRVEDPQAKNGHLDQEFSTEPVKVMWCNGITYRILCGAVPVIEISPGDGSVIRSNGIFSTYFTHHKPNVATRQVKEVTYHLHSLPPDVPGQLYSLSSVLGRASRILTCYNDTNQSVGLAATRSCLQEGGYLGKLTNSQNQCSLASVEPKRNVFRTPESRSDLVAAELEKIRRLNCILFDKHQLSDEEEEEEEGAFKAISEDFIAEAQQRTFRALQDIETLTSAATLT